MERLCEHQKSEGEFCDICHPQPNQPQSSPDGSETVYIDPRTKEPCRRCDGTGKMPPWPESKGLVPCGVCRAEERPLAYPSVGKQAATEQLYYIQDTRTYVGNGVMWWRPEGKGYTSDLNEAWKVPADKAKTMHRHRKTDVPWPCEEIDKQSQRHFDMQNLRMITEAPIEAK